MAFFETAFEAMQEHNLTLGGAAPCNNPFFAANMSMVTADLKFVWGPLHFVIVTQSTSLCKHFYFDDAERTCEAYRRDGGVLWMNHNAIVSPNEPFSTTPMGGLAGQRTPEGAKLAAIAFEAEYSDCISKVRQHKSGTPKIVLKRLPYKGTDRPTPLAKKFERQFWNQFDTICAEVQSCLQPRDSSVCEFPVTLLRHWRVLIRLMVTIFSRTTVTQIFRTSLRRYVQKSFLVALLRLWGFQIRLMLTLMIRTTVTLKDWSGTILSSRHLLIQRTLLQV